jgi:hypothetical protein
MNGKREETGKSERFLDSFWFIRSSLGHGFNEAMDLKLLLLGSEISPLFGDYSN